METTTGTKARTICPLRPYGQIEVLGKTIEAKAEGGWIDEDIEVVVVDSQSFGVVVRELVGQESNLIDSSPDGDAKAQQPPRQLSTSIPLEGPDFWLEKVRMIPVGAAAWSAIGSLLLLGGVPFNLEFLLLPAGGAIVGAILQYVVRAARDLEGPYSDHRPQAYLFALWMLGGSALAVIVAFVLGGGFAIITGGLITGALIGAMSLFAFQLF